MKKTLIGILILMASMLACVPVKHTLLNYNNEFYFNENIPYLIRTGETMDTNGDGKEDTAVCYYSFQGFRNSFPDVIAYFKIISKKRYMRDMDYMTDQRAYMVSLDYDLDGQVDRIYTDTNGDGRLNKEERYDTEDLIEGVKLK